MSLRFERTEGEFQRMLAGAIGDMKDPRISKMTSVTRAELAKDMKTAKAYVSVFEDDSARQEETVEVLNSAQAAIGRNVSKHMSLRRIPKIRFILDKGIEQSVHIGKMLDEMNIQPEAAEAGAPVAEEENVQPATVEEGGVSEA